MNIFKFCLNKNILKIVPLNVAQKYSVRTSTLQISTKPILMSYASYESTQSTNEQIPPLIIMHGLFGSKANWNSLSKAMQSKSNPPRKIISVDARNHGDSPHSSSHSYEDIASDIKYLMESQKILKTVLLGHSMGGKAMMYFALKYPELVDRLIIVDISPYSTSPSMGHTYSFFRLMQNMKLAPNIPISAARLEADTILSRVINDKGVRSFILTNLIKKADGSFTWRINIPALKSNYQKIAGFPMLGSSTFDKPTLFIIGGSSDFVQKTDITPIKHLFPKVEFISIPGAGHWLHSEKPNEFLEHVLNFINQN